MKQFYPHPTYPPYYSIIQKSGGIVIDVPLSEELTFDFDKIVNSITDKTKVIFVCNPNNPTGYTVYREEMLKFVERIPEDVIVVLDEAYMQFANNPQSLTMLPAIETHKNIIVVHTFSKIYGMAAIRIGYAVSNPEIISYMQRESVARSLNAVGIRGAIAAIDDENFVKRTLANNFEGKNYLTKEFNKLRYKVYPSEANFIYVDVNQDSRRSNKEIVILWRIIIRGDFPCLRISIGTTEQNESLITAFKEISKMYDGTVKNGE